MTDTIESFWHGWRGRGWNRENWRLYDYYPYDQQPIVVNNVPQQQPPVNHIDYWKVGIVVLLSILVVVSIVKD